MSFHNAILVFEKASSVFFIMHNVLGIDKPELNIWRKSTVSSLFDLS